MVIYPFGRTDTRAGRYSLAVLFWGLLHKVNIIRALREAYLPTLQVFFLLEPLLIPAGISLRTLPFSPTKLDTPLSQLSFTAVASSAICISNVLYKGEPQWRGF